MRPERNALLTARVQQALSTVALRDTTRLGRNISPGKGLNCPTAAIRFSNDLLCRHISALAAGRHPSARLAVDRLCTMLGASFEQQVGNNKLLQLVRKSPFYFWMAIMATVLIIDCDLCDSKKISDHMVGSRIEIESIVSAASDWLHEKLSTDASVRVLRQTGGSGDDFRFVLVGSRRPSIAAAVAAVRQFLAESNPAPVSFQTYYGRKILLGHLFRTRILRYEIDDGRLPDGVEISHIPGYDMTLGPVFGMSKDAVGCGYHFAIEKDLRDELTGDKNTAWLREHQQIERTLQSEGGRSRVFWLSVPRFGPNSPAADGQSGSGLIAATQEGPGCANADSDQVLQVLDQRFDAAMNVFSNRQCDWVSPIISRTNAISRNPSKNSKASLGIDEILQMSESVFIKAPPQFGLTCLALRLCREAWVQMHQFWVYVDCREIRPDFSPEKAVRRSGAEFGSPTPAVDCIVLDSWTTQLPHHEKFLKQLVNSFPDTRIIVLHTISDSSFGQSHAADVLGRKFEILHLLALAREQIRSIVEGFAQRRSVGEVGTVLARIASDLEALNLHRTPLNCIMTLKVAEEFMDEKPVNRTAMMEKILFLLFNLNDVQLLYKTRPDVKDCEYLLGRYAERMIRTGLHSFSRADFLTELRKYCDEKGFDLEVDIIFDVLCRCNLLVHFAGTYEFRFVSWVSYFAARRMYDDEGFAAYILGKRKKQTTFPDIIEFYTGIDRRRENALRLLLADLSMACDAVDKKFGSGPFNPFAAAKWISNQDTDLEIIRKVTAEVQRSNLPLHLKDQFSDARYDQTRPYSQVVRDVFDELAVGKLHVHVRAASLALRNSDFADKELKKGLLNVILRAWEQFSRAYLIVAPLLAAHGNAQIEGFAVQLDADSDFGNDLDTRVNRILLVVPYNVVMLLMDDLFSARMGTLLFEQLTGTSDPFERHLLALLHICRRPKGWRATVDDYVVAIPSNSFYLFEIWSVLLTQYKYADANPQSFKDMEFLIKKCVAKHSSGIKDPGLDKIVKLGPMGSGGGIPT